MSQDLVFPTQCEGSQKQRYFPLALLTRIKTQHGTRGLIASVTLVGASIGGYALAYGLLIYFS